MSTTVADYIGRKIDLVFLHGDKEDREALMDQSLFPPEFPAGQICTGMKKLIGRFVLELFTERGSMPFRPDRGCDFMSQARAGALRTQMDAIQYFTQAESLISANLTDEETDDVPDDERYAGSTLVNVQVSPGFVQLYIAVRSAAGSTAKFILPLPITIVS